MFHIAGVTPEAPDAATALAHRAPAETVRLTHADLAQAWELLDSGAAAVGGSSGEQQQQHERAGDRIELVAVGNPHLSLGECEALASLCEASSGPLHPDVSMVATVGRTVLAQAREAGHAEVLEGFGVQFVTDTCWCMLTEPVVPVDCNTLVTNSAKYAHYAPGLVNRKVRFSNMAGCVEAASTGLAPPLPDWLPRAVPGRRRSHHPSGLTSTTRRQFSTSTRPLPLGTPWMGSGQQRVLLQRWFRTAVRRL